MRAFIVAALWAGLAAPAAAGGAETLFAERTALLAADRACGLLASDVRAALEASAQQARSAVLRQGWSQARADRLRDAAAAEGVWRACADPVLVKAADDARAGYAGWGRLPQIRFPGDERVWVARRTPDPEGFHVRQDGQNAAFGIAARELVLRLPLSCDAPSAARLRFRHVGRAPRAILDVPGLTGTGLASRLPAATSAESVWASDRRILTREGKVVFSFPPDALRKLAALDPREAFAVDLDAPSGERTVLFEVGDLPAAMAFVGIF
jgi:hypothetical protein